MSKHEVDDDRIKVFTAQGLEFPYTSGKDMQGDCPFCGKQRAFHVDPFTTKWVCSSGLDVCGRTGNATTWLRQWGEFCFQETSEPQFRRLEDLRGLPWTVFRRWGVGWNPLIDRWLVPNHTPEGEIHDLRRWRKGSSPMGSPGVEAGLWNAMALYDPRYAAYPVDVCEGEWDGMAWWWLHKRLNLGGCIVGVPGANIMKPKWLPGFKGRACRLLYDNDATGQGYAEKKAAMLLEAGAVSVELLRWPGDFPDKYDVRDHVVGYRDSLRRCREDILGMLEPFAGNTAAAPTTAGTQHQPDDPEAVVVVERKVFTRPPSNPTFEETMAVYRDCFELSGDMEVMLRVMYAVVLSEQIDAEPAWTFIVGSPGMGKTATLLSLAKVDGISWHSSITAKALMSGYADNPKVKDPSVIRKLIENGVGVFKDFTQLLGASNELELQAVSRVLRGAFDGCAEQHFGNGTVRKYKGSFTLLAGVTDEIHGYSEATVGERFLKFEMAPIGRQRRQKLLLNILYRTGHASEQAAMMADAAAAFLNRDIEPCDPDDMIPRPMGKQLCALAEIIALLRHRVLWERDAGFDKVLRIRPKPELASRLVRQLAKVGMGLCRVHGVQEMGRFEYAIVERLAFNTGIGFHLDIVEAMMQHNAGRGVDRQTIEQLTMLPRTTLARRLEDLCIMDTVVPSASQPTSLGVGRPAERFDVHPHLRDLWRQAKPGDSYIAAAIASRRAAEELKKNPAVREDDA